MSYNPNFSHPPPGYEKSPISSPLPGYTNRPPRLATQPPVNRYHAPPAPAAYVYGHLPPPPSMYGPTISSYGVPPPPYVKSLAASPSSEHMQVPSPPKPHLTVDFITRPPPPSFALPPPHFNNFNVKPEPLPIKTEPSVSPIPFSFDVPPPRFNVLPQSIAPTYQIPPPYYPSPNYMPYGQEPNGYYNGYVQPPNIHQPPPPPPLPGRSFSVPPSRTNYHSSRCGLKTESINSGSSTYAKRSASNRSDTNKPLTERDKLLYEWRRNFCETSDDIARKLAELENYEEKEYWIRSSPADVYYTRTGENMVATPKLDALCTLFEQELIHRGQILRSAQKPYEPSQKKRKHKVCPHRCELFLVFFSSGHAF